jgi:S-adenosylmethionine synthetase
VTRHLFTSESVSMGHPDKVADQIADTVLDTVLAQDPTARVACEVLLTGNLAVLAGEITTDPDKDVTVDHRAIIVDVASAIGYDAESGFDAAAVRLENAVQRQSPDIARGVDGDREMGAGDQGMMFGFASTQTPEMMPLAIMLSHQLMERQAQVRRAGTIPGLRPDAKSQVTIAYDGITPLSVESVLLSTQHAPHWNQRQGELRDAVIEHILRPVLAQWWTDDIRVLVNPTGRFEVGGPAGDTGLTGRKIIVDTYGGWARHGGGAFSGKDPSKVDRSASYMARHVARTVIAAGLADECEVRLGYAIGIADPTAVWVDTHGTGKVDDVTLSGAVREVFPLTPQGIIRDLELQRPIYRPTSYHGHFGRIPGTDGTFSWERTPLTADLRGAVDA